MPDAPVKVVVSYSPEDAKYFTAIQKQLKLLENQGYLQLWSRGDIAPGANMEQETTKAIQSAQVLLLLISIDYLLSDDYLLLVNTLESLPKERILPILTGSCDWKAVPQLAKLSILPIDGVPISDKTDSQLYKEVIEEIKTVLQQIAGAALPQDKPFAAMPVAPVNPNTDNPQLVNLKYTCNRSVQKGEFLKSSLINRQQKVQYYYIRGFAKQSTEGLSKRFYHREIPGNPIFGNKNISPSFVYVPIVPDDDTEVFKLNFIADLAQQLKCTNQDIYFNSNIEQLLNALCVRTYEVVCVGVKLKSEKWSNAVPPFLEWLVADFCACKRPDMPVFLFFLMIDYASDAHLQLIEPQLRTLKDKFADMQINAQLLSPLDKVKKVDIQIWLEATLRHADDADRTKLMNQYFSQQDEYDMCDVEQKLEEIIHLYNTQIEQP